MCNIEEEECSGNTFGLRHSAVSSSRVESWNEERKKCEKERLKRSAEKESLKGSDFVQTTIQVGGYNPSTIIDFKIPNEFGLKQTIADTLGIGGIMRGLRTIPVLLDISKDIIEICPNSIWLQYVNPMCANMIAINKIYPNLKSINEQVDHIFVAVDGNKIIKLKSNYSKISNYIILLISVIVFIVASKGLSILYLFLLADLLCCSAVLLSLIHI